MFFSGGPWAQDLSAGSVIDLAYQVTLNEWNGEKKLQLIIKDVKTN
jgi:hypothetical protein